MLESRDLMDGAFGSNEEPKLALRARCRQASYCVRDRGSSKVGRRGVRKRKGALGIKLEAWGRSRKPRIEPTEL